MITRFADPASPRPLVVNARFLTQRVTGVQRYAIEVATRLKAMRPDIRFLTPRGVIHADLARQLAAETIGRLAGHAWEQLELPRHLGGSGLIGLGNTGPLWVSRQLVVLHDTATFSVPGAHATAFNLWYRFMLRRLARHARQIVTVSAFSSGELQRHLAIPSNRIAVIPPGSEHARHITADPVVLDRHGLRDRNFLLTVGSHSPHKNFAALVRAAGHLVGTPCDIVVAGGGNPRVHATGESAPGSAALRYLGAVSDGELRALFEAATGYVHPAYYEGFGLPPLEAMSLGCPVLTSRAASLPEVCGDAAWYFDPYDDDDIADAIRHFIGDEAGRARLTTLGLERADGFSWDATARRLLAVATDALT